jgi:LysR family transcriptional regulator, carnitine catabolism transcriptional activator
MDFRALEYFVAAADAGSFTKAAEQLSVAQPSLSEGIRKLEREFRTPLFHRAGRRVVLSEAGKVLLVSARRILREAEDAELAMVALRGLRGGRVSVSAPPSLSAEPLARIIGAFRRQYPAVTIAMEPAEDGALAAQAVIDARCEIALTDRPVNSPDLRGHVIASNEVVLVLPPGSLPGARGGVALTDLDGTAFLSSMPGTKTRALLDEAMQASKGARVAVETPHRDAIVPLILAGVGAAFLTRAVAAEAGRRGAVVVPLRPARRYDVLLAHRDRPLTSAAQAFLACALDRGQWAAEPGSASFKGGEESHTVEA